MRTDATSERRGTVDAAAGPAAAERPAPPAPDMETPDIGTGSDVALHDYEVARDPRVQAAGAAHRAANALAAQRRTLRLLWIALVVSLGAHLVVPAYLVTAMTRPERTSTGARRSSTTRVPRRDRTN